MIIQDGCKGIKARNVGNTSDVSFCWSCGHWSKVIGDMKCSCCKLTIRERINDRNRKEYIKILLNLEECIQGMKDPEYRFYGKEWVFWATTELLKDFEELKNSDKSERYYYFVKKIIEDGILTRVRRL